MSERDLRQLVDQLKTQTDTERQQLQDAAAARRAPLNPLGLRFVTGARVLDLATGQRGLVQRGMRWAPTNEGSYGVQLADGRMVTRSDHELEPDPTPAPVVP